MARIGEKLTDVQWRDTAVNTRCSSRFSGKVKMWPKTGDLLLVFGSNEEPSRTDMRHETWDMGHPPQPLFHNHAHIFITISFISIYPLNLFFQFHFIYFDNHLLSGFLSPPAFIPIHRVHSFGVISSSLLLLYIYIYIFFFFSQKESVMKLT